MGLHVGMKFEYIKGKAKGRKGEIVGVAGNEIKIKTRKSSPHWVNRSILEKRVRWI